MSWLGTFWSKLLRPFDFSPPSGPISLRVYPDCRPHNLVTAPLQKGALVVWRGRELAEGGMGFGSPVAFYGEPYFSRTAECAVNNSGGCLVLRKTFLMDTVQCKKIWRGPLVRGKAYPHFDRAFVRAYEHGRLRPLLRTAMALSGALDFNTHFMEAEPKGQITVYYRLSPRSLIVEADLSGLEREGRRSVVLLNEQGASFFSVYRDSSGLSLRNKGIGGWTEVKAEEASLSSPNGAVGFSLKRTDGVRLYRGLEMDKRVSWSGLDYILEGRTGFSYEVRLGGWEDG